MATAVGGWWKEGDSDHWMSAYVVWGLSLARDAGVEIKQDVLRRAATYLDEHLVEEEENPDMQAWMLHAYSVYILPYKQNSGLLGKFTNKAQENLWTRRAALNAYDRARARRRRWALGFVVGVVAGACIAALVAKSDAKIDAATSPASVSVATPPDPAPAEPAPSVEVASVAAPADPAQETPSSSAEPVPVPPPVAPTAVRPSEAALQRHDVREIQAKLRSFGFDPGPVDGIAGRTTEGAVLHYQQKRDLPQTAKVDRQLLEQLRQDGATRVAARDAPRVAQRPAKPGARRADPLQPMKDGFDRLGRWMDSLVRRSPAGQRTE